MIIPSQYNGFDYQGRRVYNVGGGVGEAMLIGAVTGAGTSAITGGDPLKGALFGGLGGAIMPGLGQALGGGTGAAAGAAGAGGAGAGATGSAAATAAGEAAGTAFAKEAANLGIAGIDYSGMIPIETGFYDPATMSNIAAPAVSTPQGLAASQINALPNLQPIAKSSYLQAMSAGTDPAAMVQEAARANVVAGQPAVQPNIITRNPTGAPAVGGALASSLFNRPTFRMPGMEEYDGPLSRFRYDPSTFTPYVPAPPNPPYRATYAEGGITQLAQGGMGAPTGPVERMSQGILGAGGMYPQSQMEKTYFATPTQMPTSAEVVGADYDARTNPYTGAMMASGGIADLGSYSDGGRLLKGPGDGMSDSIPAKIGSRQPARLADGEFVVPADVVSHLGNGSTDAGAKQLYSMMDRVRKTRTGTKKQGKQINPSKYVPA